MEEKKNKTRNTLGDLSNHLFEQLERLNDAMLRGDNLKEEIARSSSMQGISTQLIEVGKLQLEAKKLVADFRGTDEKMPRLLEDNINE